MYAVTMQRAGRGSALQGLQAPQHVPRKVHMRPSALFGKKKAQERQMTRKEPPKAPRKQTVEYGSTSWYESTRAAPTRTTREELEFRRQANFEANNGKDRKDLYTDNWDGSDYKGSGFNVLTLLALLAVLAPILGLFFAYQTYGELWG